MNETTKEKIGRKSRERWDDPEWREKELLNRKERVEDYKARGRKISDTCRKKNKGKWCIASGGYKILLGGMNGGILEHRKMMEEHLGRKLESWEIVHHKDGVKLNNDLENFKLTTRKTHIKEEHGYSKERNRKISEAKSYPGFIDDIQFLLTKWYSSYQIAKILNCSRRVTRKYEKLYRSPDTRGV